MIKVSLGLLTKTLQNGSLIMNGNLGNESNVTKRHNTDVFEREINKVDVLAYLDDRNEQEILYIP